MKLLAVDGNSIINRAFYGIRVLSTKDGIYTNGIYGFINILNKLLDEVKPDGVAVAFDLKAPTFRHKEYAGYKAGRKPMPEELVPQIPMLKELLTTMGYTVLEKEGYEADDILGTLAAAARQGGGDCVIATGDRDALQLVGGGVAVYLASTKAGRPETNIYNEEKIKEEYGVTPSEMIEVKALMGDSSDNIPGVAGVGPKTACDLISKYHNIEKIYDEIETLEIRDTLRAKLIKDKDNAFLSKKLGTIYTEVPIERDLELYRPKTTDKDAIARLLTKLEFFKLLEKMNLEAIASEENAVPKVEAVEAEILSGGMAADKITATADLLLFYEEEKPALAVCFEEQVFLIKDEFEAFFKSVSFRTHDCKKLYSAFSLKEEPKMAFDSMLAAYLLNPSGTDYTLERLFTENALGSADEITGRVQSFSKLCDIQAEKIKEAGEENLLYEIEIPLAFVLYEMEREGFYVDKSGIEAFSERLSGRIAALEEEIYDIVGYTFNINSPKQLGEALFVKLGLPHGKKTKTGYSTGAEVLENLKYESEAVELILEYRTVAKLKSTYCDGLLKVIAPDGRIHSTLNQTETRTGRISSTEPNLQNIPVRTELGREMRRFFAAKEGHVLVDADYSQIELRVLAAVADDKTMTEAFLNGTDIHTLTASQVFGIPEEMMTSELRSRAKAVNFGIVYGIGAFSLSKDIGVSVAEAKRYIEGYMNTYPNVSNYMEKVVEEAKAAGYVTTLFGRRRYLPELSSSNFNLRSFGERVARNMPIQGTAADIIKIAMIRVFRRLKAEKMESRLILQVHDELLIEAPENEAEQAAKILKEEMESAVSLTVPLTADVKNGKTWYDSK